MPVEIDEPRQQFIESHRMAHLATADAVGRPSVIPICYVFDGRSLYTPIDEKPKAVSWGRLKRLRNIEENPRVSVLIDDYEEDWSQLAYVLISGLAETIEPGGRFASEHATAISLLRGKYPQYRSMAIDRRPLIKIMPIRVKFWSASG